jgi:phosphoribosylformylglycinamidine synthase
VFRNPYLKEATQRFLKETDGLVLGICNGFQALVKLGLLPYGEIRGIGPDDPTLTFNDIGRHVSKLVTVRVASTRSPWLTGASVGDTFLVPGSHGEGRFAAADPAAIEALAAAGQIATQYCDDDGQPSNDVRVNPNGSAAAIEGITSSDGRIFGKMGHAERMRTGTAVNVPGPREQFIFEAGVRYFN